MNNIHSETEDVKGSLCISDADFEDEGIPSYEEWTSEEITGIKKTDFGKLLDEVQISKSRTSAHKYYNPLNHTTLEDIHRACEDEGLDPTPISGDHFMCECPLARHSKSKRPAEVTFKGDKLLVTCHACGDEIENYGVEFGKKLQRNHPKYFSHSTVKEVDSTTTTPKAVQVKVVPRVNYDELVLPEGASKPTATGVLSAVSYRNREEIDTTKKFIPYVFRTPDGRPTIRMNVRFYKKDGTKLVLPFTYVEKTDEWVNKNLVGVPLLYGVETLQKEDRPVLIVEGEKTANAAKKLFPDYGVITTGGANTAKTTDWSPVYGRDVVIWPDNDDSGGKYLDAVVLQLDGLVPILKRVIVPKYFPPKWDLADDLPGRYTGSYRDLLEAAEEISLLEALLAEAIRLGAQAINSPRQIRLHERKLLEIIEHTAASEQTSRRAIIEFCNAAKAGTARQNNILAQYRDMSLGIIDTQPEVVVINSIEYEIEELPVLQRASDAIAIVGHKTILYGGAGTGKSELFRGVIAAIIADSEFPFSPDNHNKLPATYTPGGVLAVALEEKTQGFIASMQKHIRAYGVAPKHELHVIDTLPANWKLYIRQYIEQHNIKHVVLDSATALAEMFGADETSSEFGGLVHNQFGKVVTDSGASFNVIHHMGKDRKAGAKGSTSIIDATDYAIMISKDSVPASGIDNRIRVLEVTKGRFYRADKYPTTRLMMEFDTDDEGAPIAYWVDTAAEMSYPGWCDTPGLRAAYKAVTERMEPGKKYSWRIVRSVVLKGVTPYKNRKQYVEALVEQSVLKITKDGRAKKYELVGSSHYTDTWDTPFDPLAEDENNEDSASFNGAEDGKKSVCRDVCEGVSKKGSTHDLEQGGVCEQNSLPTRHTHATHVPTHIKVSRTCVGGGAYKAPPTHDTDTRGLSEEEIKNENSQSDTLEVGRIFSEEEIVGHLSNRGFSVTAKPVSNTCSNGSPQKERGGNCE